MLTLIEAPSAPVVTLEQAKEHLAVIGDHDDGLLERLIAAATASFDGPQGKLGRCLISQTWRFDLGSFPSGNIHLPLPQVQEVIQIDYRDGSGASASVPSSDFVLYREIDVVATHRWPRGTAVGITFTCGFGDSADDVPADVRDAILAVVAARYAWRESEVLAQGSLSANPEIESVVDRWRTRGFG